MTERAGGTTEGRSTTVKRRDILAAAGVAVAGLMAKQAAQPVGANGSGQPLIISSANNETTGGTQLSWAGGTISSGAAFGVDGGGPLLEPYTAMIAGFATGNTAKNGVYGAAANYNNGVYGVAAGDGQGVYGHCLGAGVYGRSEQGDGVYGITWAPEGSGQAGIQGVGGGTGTYGLYAHNYHNGTGVAGESYDTGAGVKGISAIGYPLVGSVEGSGSTTNIHSAVLGLGTAGPGVQGQSASGYGLVGFTNDTAGHAALIGYANATGGIGIIGNAPGGVSPGLAGVFNGDVTINGALRVYGMPKNAAVKHPDNSYRLLYCMESPESWFEDFGVGTLVGEKAEIALDPDFTALMHTETFHIYLTPKGPLHLYVAQQSASGFTVIGTPLATTGGPKPAEGGGTFAWRVVAKRKDIVGERLAKAPPPPPLKPVTAFTVPETPVAKPPATKP